MKNERITRMIPSATVIMEGIVEELHAKGVDVVALNCGEPDFDTPKHITDACIKAMNEGKTKYISVAGIAPLKKAICKKLKEDNQVAYDPSQIVCSTGAKQALYNAVMAVIEQGDEVLIPGPCWVSYVEMVKLAEATPIVVDTTEDFHLDFDKLEKAITDKTKAIMINTPNNPTGAVYSEEELRQLADLAIKHDFYIISDEVYEKLVYESNKHFCIASISEEVKNRSIIVNGFSKAYAMTGWRLGYSAANDEITNAIAAVQGHTTSNGTTFVQWGAIDALEGPQDTIENMRLAFDERRSFLHERLNQMEGISCNRAEGAFYLMPNVSAYFGKSFNGKKIENSSDVAEFLLDEAHVATVMGDAFFAPNSIRIAYANSMENVRIGMDNMEQALKKLV